ncbi:MAG: SIR2 family protein [Microthrixaceae bacterium]
MGFDRSSAAYQELRARLTQSGGRVVPFVGAGLSVYGPPELRLPLWRELIDRLVAEGTQIGLIEEEGDAALSAALDAGRYIEAMDRLIGLLGEPNFKRIVERELDDTGRPVPPAVAELVAVGWSLIVTTNLDRLIARAYLDRHGKSPVSFTSLDTHRLAAAMAGTLTGAETLVAHIHGSLDDYPSWRLSRTHYDQLLQDPGYVEALKQLFLRQVFFVGFGLQDDDLDLMLANVAEIYPAGVGEVYALLPRSRRQNSVVLELIKRNGLRPIFYDVDDGDPDDPFAGHRAVFECLEDLALAWASGSKSIDVTLKYFPELDPFIVGRRIERDALSRMLHSAEGAVVQVIGLGGAGKTSVVQHLLASQASDLTQAGYRVVFGCSFNGADVAQLFQDLAAVTVGALPVSLPEQVERICQHMSGERTVLVLDGVEILVDDQRRVTNPYLLELIESVVRGRGTVIVTSRIPVVGGGLTHAPIVEVGPLTTAEVEEFLERWGLDRFGSEAIERLHEITAGHPLALRVLAGVLRKVPPEEALDTIERSNVIDVADEIDPLSENRLSRVLGSYLQHLDAAEVALLSAASVFDEPVPYPLFEGAVGRHYPDAPVTAPLLDRDVREVVSSLLEQRLLTASPVGEISCHPTVREYFARHAQQASIELAPIHREIASRLLGDASQEVVTITEARPLLAGARHAAACEDWTLFDDVFRRRLMREPLGYLCDYLGAWDEALAIARLAPESSHPAGGIADPVYYPLTVARSLKHLGRSGEARTAYVDGLRLAAASKDPETALYVNTFLTLLVWRGELLAADALAELNVRALSWIEDEWRHCWQTEHAFSTIAYLRLLQGHSDTAAVMFDFHEHAWDGWTGERPWTWDYYPFYRSEVILLADPSAHDRALNSIAPLLQRAIDGRWPEPASRGHLQAATVHADRASLQRDPSALVRARQSLGAASAIPIGMRVPDIAIAHRLLSLRVDLVARQIGVPGALEGVVIREQLDQAEWTMNRSGLELARPDLLAARGAAALLDGEQSVAHEAWAAAIAECRRQGNAWAPQSPRSMVHWLGLQLGAVPEFETTCSASNLISLVGEGLTPSWMQKQLDAVARPQGNTSAA